MAVPCCRPFLGHDPLIDAANIGAIAGGILVFVSGDAASAIFMLSGFRG